MARRNYGNTMLARLKQDYKDDGGGRNTTATQKRRKRHIDELEVTQLAVFRFLRAMRAELNTGIKSTQTRKENLVAFANLLAGTIDRMEKTRTPLRGKSPDRTQKAREGALAGAKDLLEDIMQNRKAYQKGIHPDDVVKY